MFQDSPMTPAEEAATLAWNEYAEAAQAANDAWRDPFATMPERREAHQRAIAAHERFKGIFLAPTPVDLGGERNRLAYEGVLLVSLLAAFVGLFLPDLIADFWPLAVTFSAVAALGGWTAHFLGRLGQHLGRRM